MISLGRWSWWKKANAARGASTPAPAIRYAKTEIRNPTLPTPALRWIAEGRIAIRGFDFDCDADAVCAFQPETYQLNFPDFVYTPQFAQAFRHDVRRATLDPNNELFVLDDGREKNNILGFLWIVICQNGWTGERYGYINNIHVVPHRRGQGLAHELLRQSDDWFRSRGIRKIRLSVTATNAAAVALYEKTGYATQRWEMEKEL